MDRLNCLAIDVSYGTMHDGPGLRTTVFLKGCPLSCRWCQNPESIRSGQEVWWEARRCIGCASCVNACLEGALHPGGGGMQIDREKCTVCGACVEECPSKAMSYIAASWSMDELVRAVLRDKPYYDQSGGGVTVSGGEALMQWAFVAEFFARLKAEGISTALDTCGYAAEEALDAVLPHADYILYDIKLMDPELHREFTGRSNERILKNLLHIRNWMEKEQQQKHIWIRTPLIPGATASAENISAIGNFLAKEMGDCIERWELCAFNAACISKYNHLNQQWDYTGYGPLRQSQADALREAALSTSFPPEKFMLTGMLAED